MPAQLNLVLLGDIEIEAKLVSQPPAHQQSACGKKSHEDPPQYLPVRSALLAYTAWHPRAL